MLAIIMIVILRPAAAALPYRRALQLARTFGFANATMPWYGRRTFLLMRDAFGHDGNVNGTKWLAAEYLARPLCDSIVLRRVLRRGRADFDTWRVEQRGTTGVDELRASDESFILATGHFSRQACMPLYVPQIIRQKITSIVLPPTALSLHPRTWWLSYHYGQMLDCLRYAQPDMDFVHPGQVGAYKRLVEKLADRRNVLIVFADAPPAAGGRGYKRPFAGFRARRFATGAARLSRLTGRPIAVCLPYLGDDKSIVLEWTRVIRPPKACGENWDRSVTDAILDDIETAIGRRPTQYVLDCLGERRWDARAERWV